MTINEFAKLLAKEEGLKKQVNIAQLKEVLRVINKILGGKLYEQIRNIWVKRIKIEI